MPFGAHRSMLQCCGLESSRIPTGSCGPRLSKGLPGWHIIHAGDIGRADVLVRLHGIAPVTAIRGNIDTADWAKHYPDTQAVQLGERSCRMR